MHRFVRIAGMATLALTLMTSLAMAKDAKLEFAPVDKTLNYKIDVQQEMHVGFQMETNHTGELSMKWMEKTEDGNSKVAVTFSNIEGTRKMGNDLQDMPLGIDGMEIWVIVSPQGEVIETDPQGSIQGQENMLVEQVVEALVPYYSSEKVGEGDSWIQDRTEEPEEDGDAKVEGKFEYFLDEIKKKDGMEIAKIVSEGKLDITQVTPNGPVKGEAKGGQEFEVAVDGGYPMKSKSTVEFDGNMNGQSLTIVFRIECEMKK